MFRAVLFTIAKTWKPPRCLLIDERIKKMWCICTTEYKSIHKEGNNAICSNMDGSKDDHAKRNKSERERSTSYQFSHSVFFDSLRPHEPQHARPLCLSPTARVYANPCPLSWWCHPTISSSVIPFSSCPQYFPASGSFQMSQLFTSGGQSIGVSASTSVHPMNTQDWSLGWTGWISLQSKGLKSLLQHHSSKASILWCSTFFIVQLSHPYMTTGKTIALTRQTFVCKVMSLLFNTLSRLVITFLPRSRHLLIYM